MSTWLPRDRKSIRPPVADWVDVRYYDGKEFYRKWAPDCYWGEDSLIGFWRHAV